MGCGTMEGDVNVEGNPTTSTSTETSTETETETETPSAPDSATETLSNEQDTNTSADEINVNVNVDVDVNKDQTGSNAPPHGLLEMGMTKKEVFEIFGTPTKVETRDYPHDVGTLWKWEESRKDSYVCVEEYFKSRCQIEFDSDGLVDDHENIKAEYVKIF